MAATIGRLYFLTVAAISGYIIYKPKVFSGWLTGIISDAITKSGKGEIKIFSFAKSVTIKDLAEMSNYTFTTVDLVVFFLFVFVLLIVGNAIIAFIGETIYSFIPSYSAAKFILIRASKGLPEEMTAEEYEEVNELFSRFDLIWTGSYQSSEGNEITYPDSKSEFDKGKKLLNKIAKMYPTDIDVVERMNAFQDFLKIMQKRSFTGARQVFYLAFFAGLCFSGYSIYKVGFSEYIKIITLNKSTIIFYLSPLILYFLALRAPTYLANRRGDGSSSFSSMFDVLEDTHIATYKITSSSGSVRYEDRAEGGSLIALIILITIKVVLFIPKTIIDYFRNFVLYI